MTTASPVRTTWTIDASHSVVEFAVKHMMVSTAKGHFRAFSGVLRIDEKDPAGSTVEATIETASIDTGEPQRDAHLRSDDFFNAERYPAITFVSRRVAVAGPERWRVTGDLTIRDITREVTLDTELEGRGRDPQNGERAGFTAETTISRKDFGLKWNALLEAGGAVVSDRVKITLHIEAVRQD